MKSLTLLLTALLLVGPDGTTPRDVMVQRVLGPEPPLHVFAGRVEPIDIIATDELTARWIVRTTGLGAPLGDRWRVPTGSSRHEVELPPVTAPTELELRLERVDGSHVRSVRVIAHPPELLEPVRVRLTREPVHLWDPDGRVARALSAARLPFRRVSHAPELEGEDTATLWQPRPGEDQRAPSVIRFRDRSSTVPWIVVREADARRVAECPLSLVESLEHDPLAQQRFIELLRSTLWTVTPNPNPSTNPTPTPKGTRL